MSDAFNIFLLRFLKSGSKRVDLGLFKLGGV